MTSYEYGFMSKCAEYGIAPTVAGRLAKLAQQPTPSVAPVPPVPAAPAAPSPPQAQQTYQNQHQQLTGMSNSLTPEQRAAYKKWSEGGGNAMLNEMFRTADGGFDRDAKRKFVQQNGNFFSGDDRAREAAINNWYKQQDQATKDRFRGSTAYKGYYSARNNQPAPMSRQERFNMYGGQSYVDRKAQNAMRARAMTVTPSQTGQRVGTPQTVSQADMDKAWGNPGMTAEQWTKQYNRSANDAIASWNRYADTAYPGTRRRGVY